MATYRGSEGEVTIDGTAIGELQRWEVNPSRPYLRDDAIGDTARTGKLDTPEWSGSLQLNLDYDDAQQATLIDVLLVNAAVPTIAFVGLVDGTGGTKQMSGNIVPLNASITAERGSLVTVEIPFNGDGQLSFSWT